jgi:hypothetical protein
VCLVKVQADYTLPSVVPDAARIGIDHGEEEANALPVLLHRPIRCPTRPESVALVRPAQPVIGGAAVSSPANGKPFAIDVEGEQHRPGPSLCSAVHRWNGGDTDAVTAEAPVHDNQHPRPTTLMSIAHARRTYSSAAPRARAVGTVRWETTPAGLGQAHLLRGVAVAGNP